MTEERGWVVTRSIAQELDIALSLCSGYERAVRLPDEAVALIATLPAEWTSQWQELLGAPRTWIGVLTMMATLSGVLPEADYSRATLAIRELTLEAALATGEQICRRYGLEPDQVSAPEERLVRMVAQMLSVTEQSLGSPLPNQELRAQMAITEVRRVIPLLRGGELHARFWLWLDRFYLEFYRAWPESKLPLMAAEEARAIDALGAREGETPPDLTWLPYENPLRHQPELAAAVQSGKARVLFWTQPFGSFDFVSLIPGLIIVAYGRPTKSLAEYLRADAEPLAERAKALSDGTRLMLLRIIRDFAMDNTHMADVLGVARPTVSIHAKILREAGLIDTRQEGRAAVHTLNAKAVRELFRSIERFLQLPEEEE